MGLDRDDLVIRRRVLQALGGHTKESAAATAPSDAAPEAYLKAHAERCALPGTIGFEQVMFDPVRRGKRLRADVADASARLQVGAGAGGLGEAALLPGSADAMAAAALRAASATSLPGPCRRSRSAPGRGRCLRATACTRCAAGRSSASPRSGSELAKGLR